MEEAIIKLSYRVTSFFLVLSFILGKESQASQQITE